MAFKEAGLSNREIAQRLGVSEGTVRYRLRKEKEKTGDGRMLKPSAVSAFEPAIGEWIEAQTSTTHPKTLRTLYSILRQFHNYDKSYDALRRYVRKRYPQLKKRGVSIRIETPPGALGQTDWKEDYRLRMGPDGRQVKVNFFILTAAFSRMPFVVVSEKRDQGSYTVCHERALRKAGGLFSYLRPDCLPTAVTSWAKGAEGLNTSFKTYLDKLGVQLFPSRPGRPTDKGKVEKRILDIFSTLDLEHTIFRDLSHLQKVLDEAVEGEAKRWRCAATGLSVAESWEYEKQFLRALPRHFPKAVVTEKHTTVRDDATVYFLGNYYQVRQELAGKGVLCLHTGQEVSIYHKGTEVAKAPYLPMARGMLYLNEEAILSAQTPLSKRTQEWAVEVARRQIEYYEKILEGAG